MRKKLENNDMLDVAKFVLALVIVSLHSKVFPTAAIPIQRLAVPIFFMISAYLFFKLAIGVWFTWWMGRRMPFAYQLAVVVLLYMFVVFSSSYDFLRSTDPCSILKILGFDYMRHTILCFFVVLTVSIALSELILRFEAKVRYLSYAY